MTNISSKIKKISPLQHDHQTNILLKFYIWKKKSYFFFCFCSYSIGVCLCSMCFSDVPFSGGNIIFSLLTPQPNQRPGYNDFYNTPALQRMVHATQVRIHLSGQYHTRVAGVNQRHRYYAINEITISGRWGV